MLTANWTFLPVREFAAHQDKWQEINLAGPASPLLSPAFLLPLIDEFADGRELLAVCGKPHAPDAMAILCKGPVGGWDTFQPSQSPIGAWLQRPELPIQPLVESLLAALPGFALAVGITQQDPDLLSRPADGKCMSTLDYIQTARITVEGSFEQYWEARGKNLKHNMKRQRSRLEKDGIKTSLEVITEPNDVAQAIADYGQLESAGWKAQGGTAIHPENAQGRFYRAMLENFCRQGRGRIFRYRFNDRVVAVDLCIEADATLIILKTTHDESIKTFSPAFLMRQEAFGKLFAERQIKRIEFYGRLMDWHSKWSNEVRTMYHVNYYRWPGLAKMQELRRAVSHRSNPTSKAADGEQVERAAEQGRTHAVTLYEDLSALPGRYEALFARAGNTSLFFTFPWYRNFIQSARAPNECLRIYAVDTAENSGIARAVLLMRCRDAGAGSMGARTLSGLSNYYTSLFGPVLDPNEPEVQKTLDTLAAAIAGDEIRWDVIDLHPLDVDTRVFPGLITAFRKAGLLVHTYFCFGNWYLQVRGRSFAEYFETLPPQIKNSVKRKKRQLEKSARSRIVIYRDGAGLDEALRAYEHIYAASWKIPEPYPQFIRGLCHACAEFGWLRLGIIYIDDQPASAQIWIVNAGIATIYKLAYDERHAKLSLGSILTAHLMEHVIDVDKVHEVDYLTGDDAYKKDWMSDRRERWGIVAFNLRTPHGVLAASRHLGGRAVKRAVDVVHRLADRWT